MSLGGNMYRGNYRMKLIECRFNMDLEEKVGAMIVNHQPPSKYSKIDNMKTTLLTERLNEYDSIMEKLGAY